MGSLTGDGPHPPSCRLFLNEALESLPLQFSLNAFIPLTQGVYFAFEKKKMSQKSYTECRRSCSIVATETRHLGSKFLETLPHPVPVL